MKRRILSSSRVALIGIVLAGLTAGNVTAQDSPKTTLSGSNTETPAANKTTASQLSSGAREVLRLVQAKIGDEIIVAFVNKSGVPYNLGASEIIFLREQGASDGVLTSMLSQHGNAPAAPAPAGIAPVATPAAAPAQPAPTYAAAAPAYVQPSTVYVSSPAPAYNYYYPSYGYSYYYPSYGYSYYPYYGYYCRPGSLSYGYGYRGYCGAVSYHGSGVYYGGGAYHAGGVYRGGSAYHGVVAHSGGSVSHGGSFNGGGSRGGHR